MADGKANETKLLKDFKAARRAAVPILVIESSDPASCVRQIRPAAKTAPLITWDKALGFFPKNKEGENALASILGPADSDDGEATNNWSITAPEEALMKAAKFPGKTSTSGGTIVFFMNLHLFVDHRIYNEAATVIQAIWNLRDVYKQNTRTAVILCPSISLPDELKQDVLVLDDPLPVDDELGSLVKSMYKAAGLDEPEAKVVTQATDAVKGLSAFSAEQVVAMSLTEKGVDIEKLWERKRKTIEQTPGLRIWRGGETFNDVRGVKNMKDYLTSIMEGEEPPTVLVFWDEMEKMFAGTQGDMSGVSQEMHGQILSWTADNDVLALMLIGHPGCSKSYIVKATSGQFKRPLVIMNISELKGSLVGQSTQQTKSALKMISAIGRPLVFGTCNNLDALSPELKDRFKLGTFFFDLPTANEREAVWDIWMSKYKLPKQDINFDEGWTPRNIRDCCELSWRLKKPLSVAKEYVVPVVRSNPQRIEALRKMAHGKFLSSSHPGLYENPKQSAKEYPEADVLRSISGGGGIGEA